MSKLQVYVPDALRARVKERLPDLNVSAVLQKALVAELAEADRRKTMDKVIRSYEREFGRITQAKREAVVARDVASARRPNAPRRGKRRAA